jgi:hypothetical protein
MAGTAAIAVLDQSGRNKKSDPKATSFGVHTAAFAYKAVDSSELSLTVGQNIVVKAKDGEWWYGETGKRVGWFPATYVVLGTKLPDDDESESDEEMELDQVLIRSSLKGELGGGKGDGVGVCVGWLLLVYLSTSLDVPKRSRGVFFCALLCRSAAVAYEALYTHNGTEGDELSIREGDQILVIEKSEDG